MTTETTTARNDRTPTILCVASFEKGHAFLRECKRQGWRVVLLTSLSLKDVARWPMEAIDDLYFMPDVEKKWDPQQTLFAVSHLARTQVFDRIVPLDDFDLEMAASLREHLRVPGMGDTTTRYFRDKLAMRVKASSEGIGVPEFVHALNDDALRAFVERVPGPWVLKPRLLAGAIGIKKVHDAPELWRKLDELGDQRSFYVLERFVPGDVFHVDALVYDSEVRFSVASGYGRPPLEVAHQGDVFTSRILERGSKDERELVATNARLLRALGLVRGASHSEYIRGRDDGKLYFLETSARVGGAHIADLVEAATGVNLWAEWAKLELAGGAAPYDVKPTREDYAGLLIALARDEHPDTSAFSDPEVVWRLDKRHHIGLVVRSPSRARVEELLASYLERVRRDHLAVAPPQDRPTE